MRKAICLCLALLLCVCLGAPAMAEGTRFGECTVVASHPGGERSYVTFSRAKLLPLDWTASVEGVQTPVELLLAEPESSVVITYMDFDGTVFPRNFGGVFFDGYLGKELQELRVGTEDAYRFNLPTGSYTLEELFAGRELSRWLDPWTQQPIMEYAGPFATLSTARDGDSLLLIQPAPRVVPSPQRLTVNGKQVDPEKYNIDGSNYFKLRDLAFLLNGTRSKFSVDWDAETGSVRIETGKKYEADGSELLVREDQSETAIPTKQSIIIDGVPRSDLRAFNLGGNNFFRLRDLGEALGFSVDYNSRTNTAAITAR